MMELSKLGATIAPRGRGKSRGGLGKYLRARGRGRGSGRPAEFHERLLLLDGDQKYSRRKLGTNTDRYKEEELELDSDGEPILPPEIDLSSFLERQLNLDVDAPILKTVDIDEDDPSEKLKKKPIAPTTRERKQDLNIRIEASYVAAPALPTEQIRNPKDEMQDFLDDLLM
ncbi:hypothetical protein BDZ89DRAFT_1101524 [Hymenopellis radicata]|nr:hypothetical protein BDZ89DRAFT_1101524 [Hymenopellis radicata]